MDAKSLRTEVFQNLESLGFRPAKSLPLPEIDQAIRPPEEIAARLMALEALFTWVCAPPQAVPTKRLKSYLNRNGLRDWLTAPEAEIIEMPREKAQQEHADVIGWRLENMWPLAWALGFEPAPDLAASQIDEKITSSLMTEFLPGLDASVADLVARAECRPREEIIAREYLFYCAHNAVRSAQLGGATVPKGFHPVVHGGAIHERRHALTWCVSPDGTWEDTDLST